MTAWRTRRDAERLGVNAKGGGTGSLTARTAPLPLSDRARLGTATLSWTTTGTRTVEIRVGAPDGPLLCRGGASGSATTGDWVHDGMVFFLQDASGATPPSTGRTLARVVVRLQPEWKGLTIAGTVAAIVNARLGLVADDVRLLPTHHESVV